MDVGGVFDDFRVPPSKWGVEIRRHRIEGGIVVEFEVERINWRRMALYLTTGSLDHYFGRKGIMLKLMKTCGAL
jgi:hypothetical protein